MPFEVMIKFFQVSVRCDLIIMLALVNNYELQNNQGEVINLTTFFFCVITPWLYLKRSNVILKKISIGRVMMTVISFLFTCHYLLQKEEYVCKDGVRGQNISCNSYSLIAHPIYISINLLFFAVLFRLLIIFWCFTAAISG